MKRKRISSVLGPYLFIAPHLVIFLVFMVFPTVLGIWISMQKWDYLNAPEFVGLGNYIQIFTPESFDNIEFLNALKNTLIFVGGCVPPLVILALVLAVLLDQEIPGKNLFRSIFYLPNTLAVSSITLMWVWMLNTDAGLINYYLEQLGLSRIAWLTEMPWPWVAIVAMTVWWCIGRNLLIFLAGLQEIPNVLYEASEIDGANSWQKFWNVTIPGLKRPFLFVTVMTTIEQFNVFGQVVMSTNGRPGISTKVLIMLIREIAFKMYRMGSAAAMAILMGIVIIVVSIVQFKLFQSERKHAARI